MKRLIVNADDYGLTRGVNRGIVEAHRRGIVTSTSWLANGAAFEPGLELARQHPQLESGVHLNLTQGRPIAPAEAVASLTGRDGRFAYAAARLGWAMLRGRVRAAEIEIELRAQIQKLIAAGIEPVHLDGHQHIHVLPGVAPAVIRLAREFGIRRVRSPWERATASGLQAEAAFPRAPARRRQWLVARAVAHYARGFEARLDAAGLIHPARFYGIRHTGRLDTAALRGLLTNLPEGDAELMCHPGYADDELRGAGTRLQASRELELQALTSAEAKDELERQQIRLIGARELERGGGRAAPRWTEHTAGAAAAPGLGGGSIRE